MTLAEIKMMMEKWYRGNFFKEDQKEFFGAKIREIEAKIQQLQQMKQRLESVLKDIENGRC